MAEAGTKNNRPVIKRDIKKHPDKVFFDMHSGRPVTTGNKDTPILSCQCGEGGMRPRARFDSVDSKLLSALFAHPRALAGPQHSLSNPSPYSQ